jgi:hypothetical protein
MTKSVAATLWEKLREWSQPIAVCVGVDIAERRDRGAVVLLEIHVTGGVPRAVVRRVRELPPLASISAAFAEAAVVIRPYASMEALIVAVDASQAASLVLQEAAEHLTARALRGISITAGGASVDDPLRPATQRMLVGRQGEKQHGVGLWTVSRNSLIGAAEVLVERSASAQHEHDVRLVFTPPAEDRDHTRKLFDQLGALRRERTDAGREKIVGGEHDDLALALAMGCHFAGAAADIGIRAQGRRGRAIEAPSALAWT